MRDSLEEEGDEERGGTRDGLRALFSPDAACSTGADPLSPDPLGASSLPTAGILSGGGSTASS